MSDPVDTLEPNQGPLQTPTPLPEKLEPPKPEFKMKVTDAQSIVRGLTSTQDPEVHIDVQYLIPLLGIDVVEEQLTAFGEMQEGSIPTPFGSTIRRKQVKAGIGSFDRVALLEALKASAFLNENGIKLPS